MPLCLLSLGSALLWLERLCQLRSRGSFAAGAAVGGIRFLPHAWATLRSCASHLGRQSGDGQGLCAFPGLSAPRLPCLRSDQLVSTPAGWLCLVTGHSGSESCTAWPRASPGVTAGCGDTGLCCWLTLLAAHCATAGLFQRSPWQAGGGGVPADNLLDESLQER